MTAPALVAMHDDPGPILAGIVEEAAALILPLWRSGLAVDTKADNSPVTEADRRGEDLILRRLEEAFPGIPVISEEDASLFGVPEAIGPRFFLVDPIDGTKAFVRGAEYFSVNIGLVEHGRIVAGAVNGPALGRTWYTTAAGAVARNQDGEARPIHARVWPKGEALALVSHTMRQQTIDALRAQYGFDHTRPMDSSLKLCIIAEGAADIYPRHGTTMEWDIAAGHAVLQAAGGSVLTETGGPFLYGKAREGFQNGWFVARGG